MVPLLAEISDKMPTVAEAAVWGCLMAGWSCSLAVLNRWLTVVPLALLILVNYCFWQECNSPDLRAGIIHELGYPWIVNIHLAWSLPFILGLPLAGTIRRLIRYRRRLKKGLCTNCDYNLTGNVSGVCPECGNPTGRPVSG